MSKLSKGHFLIFTPQSGSSIQPNGNAMGKYNNTFNVLKGQLKK